MAALSFLRLVRRVPGLNKQTEYPHLETLIEGLAETGVDVINLGQLPTPMIYHAKRRLRAAACAIVTASHNPVFVNGLKWMIGDRPPTPEDVEAMRRPADSAVPHGRTSNGGPGESQGGGLAERKRDAGRSGGVNVDGNILSVIRIIRGI